MRVSLCHVRSDAAGPRRSTGENRDAMTDLLDPRRPPLHRRRAGDPPEAVRLERRARRGRARHRVRRRVLQRRRARHRRRSRARRHEQLVRRAGGPRVAPALARRPARHRGVHPRPHRPLLRRRALRGAGARRRAGGAPRVVAHEAITARFDRYRETAGYNGIINQRQFQLAAPTFPTEFRYPDETFRDRVDLTVGGETIECHHARGETDDHVWLWAPRRRVLCTGDLFIWASPNCGNPQKVQRYAIEWAHAPCA